MLSCMYLWAVKNCYSFLAQVPAYCQGAGYESSSVLLDDAQIEDCWSVLLIQV